MADAHIIIAGQSNALGFGNDGPAPYTPTAQVQIWTGTEWDYMLPGVNTGMPANPRDWGPEVQIANDWLKTHAGTSDHLWIVKDAGTVKGSTGIAPDPSQVDWSPHSTGEMFDATMAGAADAMRNLSGGVYGFDHYDAVMWMQGEQDAYAPAKAGAYQANLTELVADAHADWHVTDFVIGRITTTAGDAASNLEVRDAQFTVGATTPDTMSFKTIGFGMQPDGLHYDAAGQVALGHAFFDGWMGLQ